MITSVHQPWVVYVDRRSLRYSARGKTFARCARTFYQAGCAFAMILLLLSLTLAFLVQEAPFQRFGTIAIFGLIPAAAVYLTGCFFRAALDVAAQLTIRPRSTTAKLTRHSETQKAPIVVP